MVESAPIMSDPQPVNDHPLGGAALAASESKPKVAPRVVGPYKAEARNLSFWYGTHQALKAVSLPFCANKITALIGPSGCGKTTLLRCFNRMHDLYSGNRYQGEIRLHPDGINIVDPAVEPLEMRLRIGMVFQKPNPFAKSIFENVAFGMRLQGINEPRVLAERVEAALRSAALWDETKDTLKKSAHELSGGQQQRLCIARALATQPEILLFDEPTSALDPIATAKIEDLLDSLRNQITILIVTHNMQQAGRIADYTAFMFQGELIEMDRTPDMFERPSFKLTEDYLTGRFG